MRLNRKGSVLLLNSLTCGINKDGAVRYKVDRKTGRRLAQIDDMLADDIGVYLKGKVPEGAVQVPLKTIFEKKLLVPRYYDGRWDLDFNEFLSSERLNAISLGELADSKVLSVGSGHGSPSSDQRVGEIPYIKVSDIRSLRVNINPTNLIPRTLAEEFWGSKRSGLKAWDLVSPNRASSNIGEFAVLLPGEEEVVLTREMYVVRVLRDGGGISPFYLLWALSLREVRRQWNRIILMQTNREDVGDRWREIRIPDPKTIKWAEEVSAPFEKYFSTLARARTKFQKAVQASPFNFIPSIKSKSTTPESSD